MFRTVCSVALLLFTACDGGQDAPATTMEDPSTPTEGGPVESGVDPNKVAGELLPAEAEALCAEVDQELEGVFGEEELAELSCKVQGILAGVLGVTAENALSGQDAGVPVDTASDLSALADFDTDEARTVCQETVDACEPQPGLSSAVQQTLMCRTPEETCQATVGELEECFTDTLDLYRSITLLVPSCSRLSPLSLLALVGAAPEQPESCVVVEEKCPGQLPPLLSEDFAGSLGGLGGLGL